MSTPPPVVYCLEAGLDPTCSHRFQQATYPALTLPTPTPSTYDYDTKMTLPWGFRLYCERCGGFRDWPDDSGVVRREVP